MTLSRIEEEKRIVKKMIEIYCRGNHQNELCDDCAELLSYAEKRLDNCKHGNKKKFCSECSIHCYTPDMRSKIKTVMRYSGPRMMFFDPIMAFKHVIKK